MAMKRRRKHPKPIRRTVRLYVGGKLTKTVHTRLTEHGARHELGGLWDRLPAPGSGVTLSRRMGPAVRVQIRYLVIDPLLGGEVYTLDTDLVKGALKI